MTSTACATNVMKNRLGYWRFKNLSHLYYFSICHCSRVLEYRVYNVLSIGTDLKAILPNFAVRNTTKCRVICFCKRIKVKEPLFLAFYKRVWFNIISWRDNSALCCVSDCKDLECFLQNQFLRWVRYKLCTLVKINFEVFWLE